MSKLPIYIIAALAISGCASVTPPPGQEDSTTFTQESSIGYKEAYRLIAKQMRGCYRVIGLFGHGYEVQNELDTEQKEGRIEIYYTGAFGAEKFEDSIYSRIVTVKEKGQGSTITTTGMRTKYAYVNHQAIKGWLRGNENCAPAKD